MSDKPKPKRPPTKGTRHGNGAGYGGPAKGAGNGSAKRNFNAGTNAQGHNAATPAPFNRRAVRMEQAEDLKDMLYKLALNGESEGARVQAANAFIDRVEGKAIATQVSMKAPLGELSDYELTSAIEAVRAAVGSAAEGSGAREESQVGSEQAEKLRPLH